MRVILVPVADRPECARALQTAFDLGERLGASVTGCHMRPHRLSDVTVSRAFAEAAWRRKSAGRAPRAARTLYEQIAAQHGYDVARQARRAPCALWQQKVGSPEMLMGIYGPLADLIVVSRPKEKGGVADMFLSSALTRSGRPVLILPARSRNPHCDRCSTAWVCACRCVRSRLLSRGERTGIASRSRRRSTPPGSRAGRGEGRSSARCCRGGAGRAPRSGSSSAAPWPGRPGLDRPPSPRCRGRGWPPARR